ncbi:hypothetical protein DPMN_128021 [Dreissena polymorpha]|uniref:NACHT domain-containing protein n=1 Tax=Dreissena polymorpha TaxID=45954 RepID=A0A9D4JZR1_DREPO|nr:hypothetical protein DPMN_128021 [Dreissena polymorpha]
MEKDGSRTKTENVVHQYKALFYKDEKLNNRVFVQGEPGIGKTTFLTKLALDWCDVAISPNQEHKTTFSDVDTLKEFKFLFYISLRDAMDKREVIEMIKTQIIDSIYDGDKREETLNLLPQILERETCIVAMDGLNEWIDRLNKCVIPLLGHCYIKCVSIITSRPWKMTDERIKDSEINSLIEIEGLIDSEELAKHIIHSLSTGNVKTHTEFMNYVNERQLRHFLTSPWLLTVLVNLWMNDKVFTDSLCQINCILIDILFKNANAKMGYFQKGNRFQCLYNTRFIQQQIDIFDALANAAFNVTFTSNKSLVFTERELLNYMSEDQLKFCLHAGVLTKRYSFNIEPWDAQFSFIHETVQEFMAAYHIANSTQDLLTHFETVLKCSVLEMSQTILYLCGLDCNKANKLINFLVDDKFLKDISCGRRLYIMGLYDREHLETFQTFNFLNINVFKSKHDLKDDRARCVALSVLFQRMVIAGCKEAQASGQNDMCIQCRHFSFISSLNESESSALKVLLMFNKSDVQSLILESNVLQISEILTVLKQSKHSLQSIKMTVTPEMNKALHQTRIQEMHITGEIDELSSGVLPSLSKLTILKIEDSIILEDILLPYTIQYISLFRCTCTALFTRRLLAQLSSFEHDVHCVLDDVNVTDCNTQQPFQSDLCSRDKISS